jgi:hypothetical protein
MIALPSLLTATLLALAAVTASPPPSKPQDVLVVARRPVDPKVISTFPADGAAVAGGQVILKITFDQPMIPEAWSYGPAGGGGFPDCLARPRLLNDRRTFVLLCSASLNSAFAVEINAAPDFVTVAHRTLPPFTLHFKTTSDASDDLHDALLAAGLTDADDPIMTWNGAGGGAASVAPPPRP